MPKINPPLKWHGGKCNLTTKLLQLMPDKVKHYLEPFAGRLSLLFARNPDNCSEVVNDLSGDLMNFWRVLQDPELFDRFSRRVQAIPFSQVEWRESAVSDIPVSGDAVIEAARFFVRCRQSLSGRMDTFTPISTSRLRRRMNEQTSAWITTIYGLPEVHERLRRVVILNDDAVKIIPKYDKPNVFVYADPPYLHLTRTATKVYGEYEMTDDDHRSLLFALKKFRGKVMLSGYRSALYDRMLQGWDLTEVPVKNSSGSGKIKQDRVECVWRNYR